MGPEGTRPLARSGAGPGPPEQTWRGPGQPEPGPGPAPSQAHLASWPWPAAGDAALRKRRPSAPRVRSPSRRPPRPCPGRISFFCPNSSIEMIHVPGSLPPEGSSPLVFSAFPKRVTAVPPPEDTLVTSRRDSVAVAASRLEPPPRGGTRPRSVSVDVPVLDISCYGTLRDVFRDRLLSLNTMTSRSLHFLRCGAGPCSVRPSPADRPSGGCRAHACAGWREDACFPLPWAHVGLGRAGSWGHMGALRVRPCGTDTPFPLLHPSGSA